MEQDSDLHSGKSEDAAYLTRPANFQRVYNPAVPDRCSGRFLDFLSNAVAHVILHARP